MMKPKSSSILAMRLSRWWNINSEVVKGYPFRQICKSRQPYLSYNFAWNYISHLRRFKKCFLTVCYKHVAPMELQIFPKGCFQNVCYKHFASKELQRFPSCCIQSC